MSYLEENGIFLFDDVVSSDYGVWLEGSGTYNAAPRRFDVVPVPGRNGSLTIDGNAFEEIDHKYHCFIGKGFGEYVGALRSALMEKIGYCRLEDSYHPEEFYLARYMAGLTANVAPAARGGQFDLVFRRDPRRFLKAGEETVELAAAGNIRNFTNFAAKPLIRVYGYGTITIGSAAITVAQGYPYIDIDSEVMDCTHGVDNANSLVTFSPNEFPTLKPGNNGVSFSGNITKLVITPRWWVI